LNILNNCNPAEESGKGRNILPLQLQTSPKCQSQLVVLPVRDELAILLEVTQFVEAPGR
jgi:hypothetical protein